MISPLIAPFFQEQRKEIMLGASFTSLYSIDVDNNFTQTLIGDTGLRGIQAIEYHKGSLYALDGSTSAMYTLNMDTAASTRVGNATRFGTGATSIIFTGGMASDQDTLYASIWNRYYTLNENTGAVVRRSSDTVGTDSQTLFTDADKNIYAFSRVSLISINKSTLARTHLGGVRFPSDHEPEGATLFRGTVYVSSEYTRGGSTTLRIYSLDLSSRAITMLYGLQSPNQPRIRSLTTAIM